MAKIISKGGSSKLYLQGTFDGKQRQVPLKTDNKTVAKTRAARFEATALLTGYQAALDELNGGRVVKPGEDLGFEDFKPLYQEFSQRGKKPLAPRTVAGNLANLKRCMVASGADTVCKISHDKVKKALLPASPTDGNRRSFSGIERSVKSIFKKDALAFYASKGHRLADPFAAVKYDSPKPEPYSMLATASREAIWDAACRGDMKDEEGNPLPPACHMIIILGLGAGMRRAEIEAARRHWFAPQPSVCLVSIQYEEGSLVQNRRGAQKRVGHFRTKSRKKRVVPIELETWEVLRRLRGSDEEGYFVPRGGHKLGGEYAKVMAWLHRMGIPDEKALQRLRKEAGSLVAAKDGILASSRLLGHHDITVTNDYYAGVENLSPVSVRGKDLVEQVAALYRVSSVELRKRLERMPKVS